MFDALLNRPFDLLKEIEQRSLEHNVGIPKDEDVREQWSGIGFRIGRERYVSPMGEVQEILPYPEMSRVPRALPWLKGIANIRGNLLPITDMKGFITGEPTPVGRQSRVLVINHMNIYTGLLVDESLGIRRFFVDDRIEAAEAANPAYSPYIDGLFHDDYGDFVWHIFNMHRLAENPQFIRAAA